MRDCKTVLSACAVLVGLAWIGPANAAETVTYIYSDVQGTVLATADAQGNVISRSAYRAYGARSAGLPAYGPGFVGGQENADTGLDEIGGRPYDPAIGIFLGLPASHRSAGTTYEGYGFARGNPLNYGARGADAQ
jgi:RHS repeat-associated protein